MTTKPEQALRDIQHFGEEGAVVPVIDVGVTSTFLNPGDMEKVFRGELEGCYLYSRHSNPTVTMFGSKLAAMDGFEAGLGVASGMAAIAAVIGQLAPSGGHMVAVGAVYGGTYALFKNVLPGRGFDVDFVGSGALADVEKAIRSGTKLVYVETMSNPLLGVADLPALGALCKKRGVKLVVDNTFTPVLVRPKDFGADVVVYSCTKYISGAADMIAGAVVGSREFIQSLVDVNSGQIMLGGAVMDPRIAHELYLRLDHLPIRMAAHSRAALALAKVADAAGVKTIYPGLEKHPQHALLKKMTNPAYGYGGMVTLSFDTAEQATKLAGRLQHEKFGLYAVSLGFSRTLITCPSLTTSSEIPPEAQASMGLSPGLLRLSVGYVGHDDLMAERFLKCLKG